LFKLRLPFHRFRTAANKSDDRLYISRLLMNQNHITVTFYGQRENSIMPYKVILCSQKHEVLKCYSWHKYKRSNDATLCSIAI